MSVVLANILIEGRIDGTAKLTPEQQGESYSSDNSRLLG